MTISLNEEGSRDEAAHARLYAQLPGKVKEALAKDAPLIHHLNGDNTWLFQLPIGDTDGGRRWYNILVEPWLNGHWDVRYAWFMRGSHSVLPAVADINEVGDLCLEVDRLSGFSSAPVRRDGTHGEDGASYERQRRIDAVMLCLAIQDHTNEATLRQLDPSIPVFGAPPAIAWVNSWQKHFQTTYSTPLWRPNESYSKVDSPLPPDVEAYHIGDSKGNVPHFESTIFLSFPAPAGSSTGKRRGLLYNPHGPADSNLLPISNDHLEIVAYFANPCDGTVFGGFTKHSNLHVARRVVQTGAKYAVETHVEQYRLSGLIPRFIRDSPLVAFDDAKKTLIEEYQSGNESIVEGILSAEERIERLRKAQDVILGVGESFVVI